MPFAAGSRLGRYEIRRSIGSGGMGEVYRARDDQLRRDVAIKVLPDGFAGDPDRRRRFEREARAAGGLNHPNILAVHDVGVEGGLLYIVTELLDGETLHDRIGGRPLPPRKAVEYALQIARGLGAAHDRGVIHRDIKPANLFVTTDGRVKILDFGLAKVSAPESADRTETIVADGVERQPVMGTAAYMSPEQARGWRIDHRTDIFTFGIVLCEMLTGGSPFRRATITETVNAILEGDPPAMPGNDPAMPALERIVRHCLEKKPEERFQNFRDLAFHLESVQAIENRADQHRGWMPSRRAWLLAGGLAVVTAASIIAAPFAMRWFSPPADDPTVHRVLRMTDSVGLEEFSSISPDRKMVAFTAAHNGRRQVFVRFLSGGPAVAVTSDDADHQLPRWLPDSASLLYFSPASPGEFQGTIHKIPALGGPSQRVIASIGGGDVSKDGRLVCFRLANERIELVTAALDGSDVQLVTALEARHYLYPRWSPDGRWVGFQAGDGFRWNIYVVPARGGQTPIPLTTDSRFIAGLTWLPDSSGIVFASSRGTTVPYLPPLSLWEVRLEGQTTRQLTPLEASYQQPDVHGSGLLSAARFDTRFDVWSYPFGAAAVENVTHGQRVTEQTAQVLTPTAAPDGRVAYLSDTGGHVNIWVTASPGAPRQITFESDPNVIIGVPIWSPDGRWIAFVSSKGNETSGFGIWLVRPDGSETHMLAPRGLGFVWSPDSKEIYYVETAPGPIKKLPVTGGEATTVFSEPVRNLIGVHQSTVYFLLERALMDGKPEFEIRAGTLGTGQARIVKTIDASRVASWQVPFNPTLSPDGNWLAMPLTDNLTTNIWALSTEDGQWRQVTDFGDRAILIARRLSWSADGKSILAAIGETNADIVLLDGLIKGVAR